MNPCKCCKGTGLEPVESPVYITTRVLKEINRVREGLLANPNYVFVGINQLEELWNAHKVACGDRLFGCEVVAVDRASFLRVSP